MPVRNEATRAEVENAPAFIRFQAWTVRKIVRVYSGKIYILHDDGPKVFGDEFDTQRLALAR